MESVIILKASDREMRDAFDKAKLFSIRHYESEGVNSFIARIRYKELPEKLHGTYTIADLNDALKNEVTRARIAPYRLMKLLREYSPSENSR